MNTTSQPPHGMPPAPASPQQTCGTCKFRGKEVMKDDPESFESKPTGYFLCGRIKHDDKYEYQPGQKAIVVDGSGYHAALCVESEFGCTAWEGRVI